MRLIDADALSKSILEWLPPDPCGRPEMEHPFETDICVSMLMEIEDAPTIDAVPVVRCKDCKHRHGDKCPMYWEEQFDIDEGDGYYDTEYIFHDYTQDDGYCHYGERREP